MRLNLASQNCVSFRIHGKATLPSANGPEIQALIDRTASYENKQSVVFAFFGSRYRFRGATHQAVGRLSKSVDADDTLSIGLWLDSIAAADNLRRPPKAIRPVSALMEISERLFGTIKVTCYAEFEYDVQRYQSRTRFPIPLIMGDPNGATHIEEAQFSRRVDSRIEYRITISEDADSVSHLVELEPVVRIGSKSVSQLFSYVQTISSQFVLRLGGEEGASS